MDEAPISPALPRPRIVVLCGSTRFRDAWVDAYARESDAGCIVLTVSRLVPEPGIEDRDPARKARVDELHKRKIDLADEVLVLNVGDYIGESTRSEIEYARLHGKLVRWLEPTKVRPLPETGAVVLRPVARPDDQVRYPPVPDEPPARRYPPAPPADDEPARPSPEPPPHPEPDSVVGDELFSRAKAGWFASRDFAGDTRDWHQLDVGERAVLVDGAARALRADYEIGPGMPRWMFCRAVRTWERVHVGRRCYVEIFSLDGPSWHAEIPLGIHVVTVADQPTREELLRVLDEALAPPRPAAARTCDGTTAGCPHPVHLAGECDEPGCTCGEGPF